MDTATGNYVYDREDLCVLGKPALSMKRFYNAMDKREGSLGKDQGMVQPFGYTNYQMDRASNTYFAQAREYNPETGRFTGEDLVKGFVDESKTLNHYSYCWNNPIQYIDSTGEFPKDQ